VRARDPAVVVHDEAGRYGGDVEERVGNMKFLKPFKNAYIIVLGNGRTMSFTEEELKVTTPTTKVVGI